MKLLVLALGLHMIWAVPAKASLVDTVLDEVKKQCNQDVKRDEAMKLVKILMRNCNVGQQVNVMADCRMNCLKKNEGSVVGEAGK